MGDGVLAYFGWPRAHEDDAERAVRAGLAVVEAVVSMAGPAARSSPLGSELPPGSSLSAIWSAKARRRSMPSSAPPPTSRHGSRPKQGAGEVVIAAGTRRAAGTGFVVDAVGKRLLKGHDTPCHCSACCARSCTDAASPVVSARHRWSAAQAELAALLHRMAASQGSRSGQAVLLTGEAGIGKSRLLHSLVEAITEDSPAQNSFNARSTQREPFWPIRKAGNRRRHRRQRRYPRGRQSSCSRKRGWWRWLEREAVLRSLLGCQDRFDKREAGQSPGPNHRVLTGHVLAAAQAGLDFYLRGLHWADRGTLDVCANSSVRLSTSRS